MKTYLIATILFLSSLLSFAQINNKIETIPGFDVTFTYTISPESIDSIDFTKTGKQIWEFSNFEHYSTLNTRIIDPSKTYYSDFFPNANYCIVEEFERQVSYIFQIVDNNSEATTLGYITEIDSLIVFCKTIDFNLIDYTYSQDTALHLTTEFYSLHENKTLLYEYSEKKYQKIVNNSYGKLIMPSGKKYDAFLTKKFHVVDSIFIDDKLDNIIDKQYELYEWYTVNKDGALYLLMSYYKDILNNYNQIIYLEETNIE